MLFAVATMDSVVIYDTQARADAARWERYVMPTCLFPCLTTLQLFSICARESWRRMDCPIVQGMRAVAMLGRIHLDSITDLAWSPCGTYLAVSSRDGFCTLAAFSDGDLGERVPADSLPQHLAVRMAAAAGKLPTR